MALWRSTKYSRMATVPIQERPRVLANALTATELSTFIGWPETGLEEIIGDLLEADFWIGITFRLRVIREKLAVRNALRFLHADFSGSDPVTLRMRFAAHS